MFGTVFLYSFFVFLSLFFSYVSKFLDRKINKELLIISFLAVGILVAFRASSVGTDTQSYINSYNFIGLESIRNFGELIRNNLFGNERLEPGFIILIKMLNWFSRNAQWLIILEAIVLYYGLYKTTYFMSLYPFLSLFLILTTGIFITSMNLLRQFMAIGICIIGYYYYDKGKIKTFIFYIFIAGFFVHRTALVFLLLPFIRKIQFTKKILVLIGFLCALVMIGPVFSIIMEMIYKIFPYYQNYANSFNLFGSGKLSAFLLLSVALISLLFGIYTERNGTFNSKFTKQNWNDMSILISLSMLFTALSWNFTQIDRVSLYFRLFYIFYIPNCIFILKGKKAKIIMTIFFILLWGTYFYYILCFKDNWNNVVPYSFV